MRRPTPRRETASSRRAGEAPSIGEERAEAPRSGRNSSSLRARLEERERTLAAIQAVVALGLENDLGRLSNALAGIACEATGSSMGGIFVIAHGRAELALAGTHGPVGDYAAAHGWIALDSPPGVVATTLRERTLRLPEDFSAEQQAVVAAANLRAVVLLPLTVEGRPIGTLALGRGSTYTEVDLEPARALAGHFATQLERVRLHADSTRRLRLLSVHAELSRIGTVAGDVTSLVQGILELAVTALDVSGASLHFVQGDHLTMAHLTNRPPPRSRPPDDIPLTPEFLNGRAALERRTVVAGPGAWPSGGNDIALRAGMKRGAATPLVSQGEVIGVLGVYRDKERGFDEDEIALLESCAAHAAAVIDHVRLFEQQRRSVEELKLLFDVGQAITSSLDLEQTLEAAATSITRMTGATCTFVSLLESGGVVLRGVACSDPALRADYRQVRLTTTEPSLSWTALQTGKPAQIADALHEPGGSHKLISRYGHCSLLAVPMSVHDEPLGVIVISDSRGPHPWTEGQVERACLVAHQVAVAVSHARLFADLSRSYEELARAQAELVRRERLAAIGELAAAVAHEVRNPLGAIFNSVGPLRRMLQGQRDPAQLLDIVAEECERLNQIVGDLLDFARPSEPSFSPTAVGSLISSVVEAAAASATSAGVQIATHVPADLPPPALDARLMRQALLNLVINAVQASPRGEQVRIGVAHEAGDVLRIEVEDAGAGVAPQVAARMFEPFFTTKAAGTGLGLTIVKRIVEAHHGSISCEPGPARGAHFVLRLPILGEP
jgi:signal transduction histidine kinase/putative methionine-R-sulfoxide reductase with GAF domain